MNKICVPNDVLEVLNKGVVIPALPLALDENRKIDEQYQRAILRYYFDAGVGGVAVAVHTTQFEIREPKYNIFDRILSIAKEEFDLYTTKNNKPIIRVGGILGKTDQAIVEAKTLVKYNYHTGLLSLSAFKDSSNKELIDHCKKIAEHIPIIGFYLQTAVGGRKLNKSFWKEFAKIDNVVAIKIAPFNRYQTLEVVRGVAESGRSEKIALYTGNDDNILVDLLTEYKVKVGDNFIKKRIVGGLLGHWAVWTRTAVELLDRVHSDNYGGDIKAVLALAAKITDSNSAFFDSANDFNGVIVGLHEVLKRQGLMKGIWTLNENDKLSPGQLAEIDRVYNDYPELNDDDFVKENLEKWLNN